MKIEIKKHLDTEYYNLYVNDNIAVSLESMQVCSNIKEALENNVPQGYYSEGAEVADVIRRHYEPA